MPSVRIFPLRSFTDKVVVLVLIAISACNFNRTFFKLGTVRMALDQDQTAISV